MSVKIELPPNLSGRPEQQIAQLHRFMFRLSENLNVALNNLNPENFASVAEYHRTVSGISGGEGQTGGLGFGTTYNELRALIVNTASIVRNEMDVLRRTLEGKYTAISDNWGEFQENISSTIEATAAGVIQSYGYDADIKTLKDAAAGFSAYQVSTEGYIKQGFIDYDGNGVPILGIAIGQGLTSKTVTVDGEEYQQIDETQSCAFYTASKVSFRVNGSEAAYVSNSKLYIGDVEIKGSVIFNDKWMLQTIDDFKIKWIGGDV